MGKQSPVPPRRPILSIERLMDGGGMVETGAGRSAPRHVRPLAKEGYVRRDSVAEIDNRRSSFYLTLSWARALAARELRPSPACNAIIGSRSRRSASPGPPASRALV